VKLDKPVKGDREKQYEQFSRFPHMFLGVGQYPPPTAQKPEAQWYLRIRLVTSGELGAGTDADIVAHVGGKRHVLDYMPRHNPLLAYNDFEAGDEPVPAPSWKLRQIAPVWIGLTTWGEWGANAGPT
jgi:hypothetical protein